MFSYEYVLIMHIMLRNVIQVMYVLVYSVLASILYRHILYLVYALLYYSPGLGRATTSRVATWQPMSVRKAR